MIIFELLLPADELIKLKINSFGHCCDGSLSDILHGKTDNFLDTLSGKVFSYIPMHTWRILCKGLAKLTRSSNTVFSANFEELMALNNFVVLSLVHGK